MPFHSPFISSVFQFCLLCLRSIFLRFPWLATTSASHLVAELLLCLKFTSEDFFLLYLNKSTSFLTPQFILKISNHLPAPIWVKLSSCRKLNMFNQTGNKQTKRNHMSVSLPALSVFLIRAGTPPLVFLVLPPFFFVSLFLLVLLPFLLFVFL